MSMADVDLSTVIGYVLDRTDLRMKDCASLQLVSQSMNVVVCSQFYPHVQSVARLGLTDRMVSRALQNSQVFFQRFPVMKDLHVPWNPQTIDTTAAITPAQACQLLTDYPQIQSLPPVYLERDGIEGLRGHSVRTATFYPGRCDRANDTNDQASEWSIGAVEEFEGYTDGGEESSEENVEMVSMTNEGLQVEELEVVFLSPHSKGLLLMPSFLNCDGVKELRCHRPVPIRCLYFSVRILLLRLLKTARVKNISRIHLSVVAGYKTSGFPEIYSDMNDIVLPSLESFNLEVVRYRDDSTHSRNGVFFDVDIDCALLRCFPNLQELSTPGVGYFKKPGYLLAAQADQSSFENSLRLIASSGMTRLRLHHSDNSIIGLVQEHLVACETIEDVDFRGSWSLSTDCVVSFLRVFPQLKKLDLSDCKLIDDSLLSAIQNLACLVELDVCDTRCSYDGLREFIRWRYQQIKELNLDMKRLDIRISYNHEIRLPEKISFPKDLTQGARVRVETY